MLRSMIAGRLSPVGEPICLRRVDSDERSFVPPEYTLLLANSGTAALSLAMSVAAARYPSRRAEVILPAYACPDLLAAAYYAGLEPVLVDIYPDSPRYQLPALGLAITDNTVGIVAVNFLGISEDLLALQALCKSRDIVLIEDDAQFFPLTSGPESYTGDLVVHSFGRGKPISQVGGGALLVQEALHDYLQPLAKSLPAQGLDERRWRFKARLFNWVLRPHAYQLLSMLPFLHIGETRYHSLEAIQCMDAWRLGYVQANVELYRQRDRQLQHRIDSSLAALPQDSLVNLPRKLSSLQGPLLRYPLLCATAADCDALFAQMDRQGLGVTRMYQRALPGIEGIPRPITGSYPGATQFASRLLTLPLTSFVDERRLAQIKQVLQGFAGSD
jgi:dTDP-4-amino-4,6-dideoxygalactose transaminase